MRNAQMEKREKRVRESERERESESFQKWE